MRIVIRIDTANAAFDPNPELEVKRILEELIKRIEQGLPQDSIKLRDINGNRVGGAFLGGGRREITV